MQKKKKTDDENLYRLKGMSTKTQPVVILCGGMGTRLKEETDYKPKPMVEVGGKPILWHIMRIYSHYGYRKFILCLGYKGEMIVDYFANYKTRSRDFSMKIGEDQKKEFYFSKNAEDYDVGAWEITFAYTGQDTMTGGRIKRVEEYIDTDYFLATYGDGVSDISIDRLVEFHQAHGKTATLTGVHMPTTFGIIEEDGKGLITHFREKPVMPGLINGGFFVFNRNFLDLIEGDHIVLEQEPMKELVRQGELLMYKHEKFWKCMDTYKDYQMLNGIWAQGDAPWKVW